jgi:hypothetical protein
MALLERVGVADAVGRDRLYPTRPGWFAAMDHALRDAKGMVQGKADSRIEAYLDAASTSP